MRDRLRTVGAWMLASGSLVLGCAAPYVAPFDVQSSSDDRTYAFSQQNPVKLGGADQGQASKHRDRYLDSLRGPNGEPVSYVSHGTCCPFAVAAPSPRTAELEVVLVAYRGISHPMLLYLDFSQYEEPKAPVGFGFGVPAGR